jgi:hypothetical protein
MSSTNTQGMAGIGASEFIPGAFYLKNVQLLIDQKGIAYSRHCEGCHNPIALISGVLTKASKVARPFDEERVTCSVFHSLTRLDSKGAPEAM